MDTLNKNGGPKTEAGKAISKYNAVRHGILTRILLSDELKEANTIQNKLIGVLSYASTSAGAETFFRYITTSKRQFYRALHELQRISKQ